MLDLEGEGWYGFVVNREHLFLRNIYTPFELKEMNIETIESALDDGDVSDEIKNFLVEDLDDCYPTLSELKDDIHHIDMPKKKFTSKNIIF